MPIDRPRRVPDPETPATIAAECRRLFFRSAADTLSLSFVALTVVIAFVAILANERDSPTEAQTCPTARVRLNPIEYELQKRTCQALQHGWKG